MNNETLRKAQQSTRIIYLRSIQGMQDMAFQRVQFSKIFPWEHATGPPYIILVIGVDSPLVSPVTWCLMFSYKNKIYI